MVFESLKVTGGNDHTIKLSVKPLKDPEIVRGLLIVSFEELPVKMGEKPDHIQVDPLIIGSKQIKALENELTLTKKRLNSTIEEMTTSNEELKSANEELQSMNEESQSTNEELETSKEELQSINEELATVNSELQIKIDELSRINDDMTNLFNSTEIATVFVDNDLNIRRFTTEATKIIKLIESDVGRPLSDITSNINYPELVEDIQEVIERTTFKEKEVNTAEGEWYKVRIMPYKTSMNIIDGATLTFIDISSMKNIQKKMLSALNYAEDMIDTVREPLIVLDHDMRVISANLSFYKTFELERSVTEGEKLYRIGDGEWNVPSLLKLLEELLQTGTEMNDFEFEHDFPEIGHKKLLLNARRIYRGDIDTETILLAIRDVKNGY